MRPAHLAGGVLGILFAIPLAAGSVVPRHEHENEQVANVVEGRLRFVVGGEELPRVRRDLGRHHDGGTTERPCHPRESGILDDGRGRPRDHPPARNSGQGCNCSKPDCRSTPTV